MNHTAEKFDLYLFEADKHVRERRFLQTMLGSEVPRAGDLLELNEHTKVLHQKYEVVQVHRFYTSQYELREPRVYVRMIES